MFIRLMALLALMLPAAALAQVAPKSTTVEILATGQFDAPATTYIVAGTYSVDAADEAATRKAQSEKQAAVRAALRVIGVPDAALTLVAGTDYITSEFDGMSNSAEYTDVDIVDANAVTAGDYENVVDSDPSTSVTDTLSVRVGSAEQAAAVRRELMQAGVIVSPPVGVLDDPDGARRRAKTMALDNARADAMAYAKALGLRIVRVVRISETGNGLFLPGFQDKFSKVIAGGPEGLRSMFEVKPGFVHVEATIIVEFELAP